ncbi:DUF6794 domain-containing protein [Lacinutrix iliipiscaria]|uniref:DUF6794 domain-containing protein n=1 Tax=Lacinutrix iliipiscaria TaxID=1230532 RepID=A0ABW5WNB6_9FLAO
MKTFILILLILSIQSCNKREEIPKELIYSFEYLNENWDSKEIENFKNYSENDTTPRNYHFGIGMYLRNNLLRHHEQSENLNDFFNSIGIYHYDDMSSIILTSYQRYLNNQNIELESQVNRFKDYWEPIFECAEIQLKKGLEIYKNYKVNDTINIKMPVSENNSVVDYPCPTMDWEFRNSFDLSVDGIITEKYFIYDSTNVFFTIKVLTKNNLNTKIMMEEINIGDEFKVSLRETVWKIKTTGNNVYN